MEPMQRTRRYWTGVHSAMRVAVLLALGALFLAAWPSGAAAKERESRRGDEAREDTKDDRKAGESLSFDMVVATGAARCLPQARGHVSIRTEGDNQRMTVEVEGLPPRTTFTLFVLQVPTGPFGLSWYQGDIVTDDDGRGRGRFVGIFSSESFIIAQAVRPAPQTHPGVDAATNPVTAPVHTYHLGMWFSDPADGAASGCGNGTTPFDGDHVAGIQVLNTSNFPDAAGPLGQLEQ